MEGNMSEVMPKTSSMGTEFTHIRMELQFPALGTKTNNMDLVSLLERTAFGSTLLGTWERKLRHSIQIKLKTYAT